MLTPKFSESHRGLSLVTGLLLFLTASVSQATITYYQTVIADNPTAYWRLGETSGTTAFDETVNNRDGTYAGSYTQGQPDALLGDTDPAVDFSAGQVTVADAGGTLGAPSTLSVEMWLTADTVAGF